MARGVPEAGLTFALAMMLGIMSTLAVVAVSTILARDTILRFLAAHGASMEKVTRGLDGAVGTFLILLALRTVV
jgi:nickel/cobalt transporter (NicO) family protein